MEKLNSPLTEKELEKIDRFYAANKNQIRSPKNVTNLDTFIQSNAIFNEAIDGLTRFEKTKSWMYLYKLCGKSNKDVKLKKRSPYVLMGIIFLCAVILGGVLYATKNNDVVSVESSDDNALPKPISENPYWNYTKSDFPRYFEKWGESGVKKISEIERLAVHKIANTQNSCDGISMVGLAESRSTPNEKIVVFVDCDNSERFYLSDSDLNTDTNVKSQTEKAISQSDAYDQCVEMVKLNAKHPSTVNFKMLDSNGFTAKTTGNVVINIGFEAKNDFGANLPVNARCVFTPDGEKEINITEN